MRETVNVTKILDVPADKAWAAIAGIDGLDRWFPVIAACRVEGQGVGALRLMEVEGGGRIVDRVDEINDQERRFRYDRTESPFPVTLYLGTVVVRDHGDHQAELSWTVEVDAGEEDRAGLAEFLHQALSDGISGMERELR